MDLDIPDVPAINSGSALVDTADQPKADGEWVVVENEARQATSIAAPAAQSVLSTSADGAKAHGSISDTPDQHAASADAGDPGNDTLPESMFDGEEFSAFDDGIGADSSLPNFEPGDDAGLLDFEGAFNSSADA
jgi:hypothetical protein